MGRGEWEGEEGEKGAGTCKKREAEVEAEEGGQVYADLVRGS